MVMLRTCYVLCLSCTLGDLGAWIPIRGGVPTPWGSSKTEKKKKRRRRRVIPVCGPANYLAFIENPQPV